MKAAVLAAVSAIVIRVGKHHPHQKRHSLAKLGGADPTPPPVGGSAPGSAPAGTPPPLPPPAAAGMAPHIAHHDKYTATNEYDTDYAVEKLKGGYDVTPVDNFSQKEDAALPTPLDGEALVKEIDA
jgi:hypothetical protein